MDYEFLLERIKPPWKQRIRSLLVDCPSSPSQWKMGDLVTGFGLVDRAFESTIDFQCGAFCTGIGLKFDQHPFATMFLDTPEASILLPPGITFGFEDVKVEAFNPLRLSITGDSKIWYIPEFIKEMPFTMCHQYVGGFDGWGRAIQWLQDKRKIRVSRTISIDVDYDVMHVWSLKSSESFWTKKIPVQHSDTGISTGVASCIQDHSWFNLCRSQYNTCFTLSPPCQPWSQGGRGFGVECDNGMCFVESIYTIKLVRPLFVCMEGSDSTPSHRHYAILRAGLILAGYKQLWSNVSHYQGISKMNRSRWLAIWVRIDIPFEAFSGSLGLFDGAKCAWDDAKYSFFIPPQMDHQLFLSHHLKNIYGDFKWLPKSKGQGLSVSSSQDDVLSARCIRRSDTLPTLCASYSQQHALATSHLDAKGIYATLVVKQGKFAFIDPMRFIPLFGMPHNQVGILPVKIDLCFHQLGNAITVPHALLALLVGFNSIGITNLPVINTVLNCWNERAFSDRMIVLRNEDFLFVVPCSDVKLWIPKCIIPRDVNEGVEIVVGENHECVKFSPYDTIATVASLFGIQNPQEQGISCHSNYKNVLWDSNIGDFEGCSITLYKETTVCFGFNIPLDPTQRIEASVASDTRSLPELHLFREHSNLHTPFDGTSISEQSLAVSRDSPALKNDDAKFEPCSVVKCAVLSPGFAGVKEIEVPSNADDSTVSNVLQAVFSSSLAQKEANWVECNFLTIDGFDRIFLVELKGDTSSDSVLLVLSLNGNNPVCFVSKKTELPINILTQRNIHAKGFRVNGQFADPFILTNFRDGDVIDCLVEECKAVELQKEKKQRIELFSTTGVKTASDEFSFALDLIKIANQDIHVAPIADIRSPGGNTSYIKLQQAFSGIGHLVMYHVDTAILPVFIHDHWCAIEIHKEGNTVAVTSVGVPQHEDAKFRKIAADAMSFPEIAIKHFTMPLPSFPCMCGWLLLRRWLIRYTPELFEQIVAFEASSGFEPSLSSVCEEPIEFQCPVTIRILGFAKQFRSLFIASYACPPGSKHLWPFPLLIGGTMEVDKKPEDNRHPGKGEDPWKAFDPWMQKSGLKQAKWEDLRLPSDHPFVNLEGRPIKQVHKQKLSTNTGGVAFATKSALSELMKIEANDPVAILIPNGDKKLSNAIQPQPSVSGPFEVVVEDPVSGQIYKRQVLLVQSKPLIKYQLAKPTYSATLPELKELVLEIDSRLATRELCIALSEKPLDAFRSKAADQYPPTTFQGVKMYAYRKFTPSGADSSHVVHQVMCKLPNEKRIIAIERSGLGFITCRDFLAKGETTSDLTVIPRFWDIDKGSKDEAIRAVTGIEGFAGLIVSRRGIAARSWISKIADLRRALLSNDERISDLNIGVVPRVLFDSTGWPISISPHELIKATFHAVQLAPVPTRCHRQLGVTCWQLAFEEDPKVMKFVVKFNSQSHEILLTQPGTSVAQKQGKKQPIGKSVPQHRASQQLANQAVTEDPVAERVSILEAKFQTFEKRQEKVERQLETGFDSLQSQLRQVLNAVAGPREKSPSGETPPPKAQKHL